MKLNKTHLVVAIVCFFITSFVGDTYRAWAWGNSVNDLGLADAWTNVWGVPTALFFWSGLGRFRSRFGDRLYALTGAIAFIVYELLQPRLVSGVCDIRDMAGSLVGALIALLMFSVSARFRRENSKNNYSSGRHP